MKRSKQFVICLLGIIYFISPLKLYSSTPVNVLNISEPSETSNCKEAPTIFVSIASYRDPQCPVTLRELFNKAQCPSRIYVGICQQNNEKEDIDCKKAYCQQNKNCLSDQIRIIRLKHTEAKGPTWARYLAATLRKNEDYYFQLDSHTLFLPNWDFKLIKMIEKNPWGKAIVSHYPLAYEYNTHFIHEDYKNLVPALCNSFFNQDGILQALSEIRSTIVLKPLPLIAAGMMFGPSRVLSEVPLDPHLPFLFHGEELLYSARLYAAGWRAFMPTENVVFHNYNRKHSPSVWNDVPGWIELQKKSLQRLNSILDIQENFKETEDLLGEKDEYWINNKESLKQFNIQFGIDWVNKRVTKKWCSTD